MMNILVIAFILLKTFIIIKKKLKLMNKFAFALTIIFVVLTSISLVMNLVSRNWDVSVWISCSLIWAANTALHQYMNIYITPPKNP